MLQRWLLLLVACIPAALAGCGPAVQPPRVWAADDMVHLTDRTPATAAGEGWEAEKATIRLFSAANETVSFQLVIDAGQTPLEQLRLSVGPLVAGEGKIGAQDIRLFAMRAVRIDRYPAWYLRLAETAVQPAGFYDALAPLDEAAKQPGVELPAGGRLAIWVDVRVPRQALSGEYAGPIAVSYRGGSARASLRLQVYDFVLPDARPIACIGGFSNETIFRQLGRAAPARMDASEEHVRAALVVVRRLMRLAHEHRLDLFDKTIHPLLKRDSFGAVTLRWEDYDNIVKPYLDGTAFDDRIGVAAWPAPLWLEAPPEEATTQPASAGWPAERDYGGSDSPAYRETAVAVLRESVKHFQALGAGEKLFLWTRTGQAGQASYRRFAALARLARTAEAELPILTMLSPAPPPETNLTVPEDFPQLAEMYAPPADMFTPAEVARIARRDHPLGGLWLRPGRPPYLGGCDVLALPADVRALPWVAMKYDCTGIFLPEVLDWSGDPFRAAGESAGRLFHPGPSGEVWPSVRLKRLRRGLQDAAYLWLLRQRRRPAVAQAIIDTMVHYAALDAAGDHYLDARLDGWAREGSLWPTARRLLAEEVLAAVHPEDVSNRELLALGIARKQLSQKACLVRLERVRTRVTTTPEGLFEAAVGLELYNELVRPAEATARLGALPPGWQAVQASRTALIEGGAHAVVELIARGDSVPTGFDAKMKIPVTLTAELSDRRELTAEVPFLMVAQASRPITIDGDLGDWPLRPGNTAASFKLLGRRGRVGEGLAKRQTAVFAVRDDHNLYLAFRCDEPQINSIVAFPNNLVRHEQLMACGEDLVEVILDPGRNGTTAEDLYHLTVKCNGVLVAERGVSTDPPLGRARPWPVAARVAVARRENLWIVELALPLEAFGSGWPPRLWGANFTRFATAEAEASSWAGAGRYFYSPRDLGALYLVPQAGGASRLAPTSREGQ